MMSRFLIDNIYVRVYDRINMKGRVVITLIFLAIFFVSGSLSFAKEITPTSSPSATPTPKVEAINYELPYPGLLPDNPLYFLKAARDRVIQFLISDPVKKAEFNLLSSDKRTSTALHLINKNKDDMGVLYISKGNNYMHMAIIDAKNSGERAKTVLDRIKTSIKKHEEVIGSVLSSVDKTNRTKLQQELNRLRDLETLISGKSK